MGVAIVLLNGRVTDMTNLIARYALPNKNILNRRVLGVELYVYDDNDKRFIVLFGTHTAVIEWRCL